MCVRVRVCLRVSLRVRIGVSTHMRVCKYNYVHPGALLQLFLGMCMFDHWVQVDTGTFQVACVCAYCLATRFLILICVFWLVCSQYYACRRRVLECVASSL